MVGAYSFRTVYPHFAHFHPRQFWNSTSRCQRAHSALNDNNGEHTIAQHMTDTHFNEESNTVRQHREKLQRPCCSREQNGCNE
jgi:hypothetical protein